MDRPLSAGWAEDTLMSQHKSQVPAVCLLWHRWRLASLWRRVVGLPATFQCLHRKTSCRDLWPWQPGCFFLPMNAPQWSMGSDVPQIPKLGVDCRDVRVTPACTNLQRTFSAMLDIFWLFFCFYIFALPCLEVSMGCCFAFIKILQEADMVPSRFGGKKELML